MSERIEECRGTPYSVGYRWDETEKIWVVRIIDEAGEQVGDSEIVPSRDFLPEVLQRVIQRAYILADEG